MRNTFTFLKSFLIIPVIFAGITVNATGDEKGSRSAGSASKEVKAIVNLRNSSAPGVIYYDNMDSSNDTTSLMARGYYVYYRGTGPQGTTAVWYTGIPTVFTAYSGPDSGYVAANYNIVTGANNIDSWLVLPDLNITSGDTLSFWSRSPDGSTYPDSIRVMYSAAGDILPEAASWVQIGNFKVSTSGWGYNEFYAPASGANGRFAIRYNVVNGGPQGSNSDYIGIDDIMVTGASGGVGINELSNENFSISPNPAFEKINIKISNFSGNEIDLKIVNMLGQNIKEEKLIVNQKNIDSVIDISDLQKGTYFVVLGKEENKIVRKLIVE